MFSRRFIAITALSLILLVAPTVAEAQKGKAPSCTDIPIWVTIVPVADGILFGDGSGPEASIYRAGVGGVDAKINICGTSPTYNATLWLANSTRTMGFNFPGAIEGSIISGPPPVWAGSAFQAKPLWYVKDILWGRRNGGNTTFTTWVTIEAVAPLGDKKLHDLRLQSPEADTKNGPSSSWDTNMPQNTSKVTVQDFRGNTCSGGTIPDTWVVTVHDPFVGTLNAQNFQKYRGDQKLHSGQYRVPFQLKIEARGCVPF